MLRLVAIAAVAACTYPDAPPCPLALSYPFTPGTGMAQDLGSAEMYPDSFLWYAPLAGSGASLLTAGLQIYSGGGSDNSPDWPTTGFTPKSGIVLPSFDVVVFIIEGCLDAPTAYYESITGTVNITSVSPDFAGTVTAVTVQHDDGGGAMPDADMCTSSLPAFSFDAPLQQAGS